MGKVPSKRVTLSSRDKVSNSLTPTSDLTSEVCSGVPTLHRFDSKFGSRHLTPRPVKVPRVGRGMNKGNSTPVLLRRTETEEGSCGDVVGLSLPRT